MGSGALSARAPEQVQAGTGSRVSTRHAGRVVGRVGVERGLDPFLTRLERFRSLAGDSEAEVPRRRPPYPEGFRREAIRLAKLGDKPQRKLAKDLGISDVILRRWLNEERAARGERPGGLSADEREELQRLRDENAKLRMERGILRKAADSFARGDDG